MFGIRPTNRGSITGDMRTANTLQVGIADDQAKDFDFEKTEMKYDSTGMFHWSPSRILEDCILVIFDYHCDFSCDDNLYISVWFLCCGVLLITN